MADTKATKSQLHLKTDYDATGHNIAVFGNTHPHSLDLDRLGGVFIRQHTLGPHWRFPMQAKVAVLAYVEKAGGSVTKINTVTTKDPEPTGLASTGGLSDDYNALVLSFMTGGI